MFLEVNYLYRLVYSLERLVEVKVTDTPNHFPLTWKDRNLERLQENTTKEIKEISIKRYELWQRQSTKSFKFKINFELIDRMSCNVAQNLQNVNDY